ncbi:L,D-transpeptidase family protein [Patescibacteria group bacterium]|nr:L,D-transpeptidase family protein [Patescibacteria group bacterium]
MKKINRLIIFTVILLGIIFLSPQDGLATFQRETEVKVFLSGEMTSYASFKPFDSEFMGGADVAAGDLGGDGIDEIILGSGPGGQPTITILRGDGSEITNFLAYGQYFDRGVNVSACDLDNDGNDEIVTGTRYGGGPQVRVFDSEGNPKFTPGFYAYDIHFRGGVNVACGDITGDGYAEIITGPGPSGGPHVRVFNRYGEYLGLDFFPFEESFRGGVDVAVANFDGGPEMELITSRQSYGRSQVITFKVSPEQYVIGDFIVFTDDFLGGVNLAGGDIDHDGFDEVITSANAGGGPHIRSFEGYGDFTGKQLFAYESEFRGGTNVALGDLDGGGLPEIFVVPNSKVLEGRTDLYKYIEIDISEQRMRYYENGFKIGEYPVSSGKVGMPTPYGEYKVMNKSLDAYSSAYDLWMPWWMQFTGQGHGIHGLPYWKLGGGGVLKEGENHLGMRVSHGCIRLPWDGAEIIYDWATPGTPIVIHE